VTDKVEPKINDYQYFLERDGKAFHSPEGAYLTDMFSEEAVRFVSHHAGRPDPFFLYLAYNAPHSPLQAKTEDLKKLFPDHPPANPGNGVDYKDYEKQQNYVAMMYAIDRGVGQLVKTLIDPNADGDKRDSILDQTLIVFLSDNGGKVLQGANSAPLQADKGSTLEGGIRVPMFMHWPKQVPAGKVFDHPVHTLDFYPTFAGLARARIPADKKLDGVDIWEAFQAGRDPNPNEPMFWLRHHGVGNEVAVRRGKYKAYRKNFGAWRVFDVTTDFSESHDLAKQHAERLSILIKDGLDWSETLQEPPWHDTKAGQESWRENKMPRFEETFRMR
jgi:arylsulfatase B